MFSDRLADIILRGMPQAVLVSVVFTLIAFVMPPLGMISGGVIALVTLRIGPAQGALLAVISSVALGVLVLFTGLPPVVGVLAGALQWLPVVAMAAVLRRTTSWTLTLQATIAAGIAVILLVYAIKPDMAVFWQNILDQYLRPVFQASGQATPQQDQVIEQLAANLTGLLVASFLATAVLALMLGRYLQAVKFNPSGFGEEFTQLRLGLWPAVVVVGCIALSLATGWALPYGLALIIGSIFIFQGLAVIHASCRQMEGSKPKIILAFVYVSLIFMMSSAFMMISGLGVADAFANFRARFQKQKTE